MANRENGASWCLALGKPNAHRIAGLVRSGSAPAPVPGDLVMRQMGRRGRDGKPLTQPPPGSRGRVGLMRGPFAEFAAAIEANAPARRARVLPDLIGQQIRVAVDAGQVRNM